MPNARIYWLHALTPTHAGVGRGVGYIDLPIDRDKVTNWPLIRGSAFKGVWADHYKANEDNRKKRSRIRCRVRRPFRHRRQRLELRFADSDRCPPRVPAGAKLPQVRLRGAPPRWRCKCFAAL